MTYKNFLRMFLVISVILLMTACSPTKSNKIDQLDTNDQSKTDKNNSESTSEDTIQKDKDETTTEGKTEEEKIEEAKTEAPDFTLGDGKGNNYTLSDYKGKLVLVNFFTTWCGYCEEEMPDFQKIHEKYKDEDVAILAINVQQDSKEISIDGVLEWVEERNLTFPVLFDEDGTATDNYYISGYPTTYVIDKEGYVIGYVNAMNEEMLEKLISMYR